MSTHTYVYTLLLAVFCFFLPPVIHAQTADELMQDILDALQTASETGDYDATQGFARDGIYGCTGAAYGSVGKQGPGGKYVPVFSDAEFDQARLITYKECLLDGIVNSMRETLISYIIKSVVNWANEGFEGNPSYVENLPLHMLERIADPEAERVILGPETDNLNETFRTDVRVALAKYYANRTRKPASNLTCGLSTESLDGISSSTGSWDDWFTFLTNPSCNPLFAYYNAKSRLDSADTAVREVEQTQLDWGSGFRTSETERTIDVGDGQTVTLSRITTPGILIAQHIEQLIGTGLRQSESADEIDEIVSALMSNLGTQMLTGLEGLEGLSKSNNGVASYLDRLTADSSARTRGLMTDAAITVLNNTIGVEQEYRATRLGSGAVLKNAENQLRTWENVCWRAMINQAKIDLAEQYKTCVGTEGTDCTPAVVTENIASNSLGVETNYVDEITAYGRGNSYNSTISVSMTNGAYSSGTATPTLKPDATWKGEATDVTDAPAGTITVTANETAGNGGTYASLSVAVLKTTSLLGSELIPPLEDVPIELTVTRISTSGAGVITITIIPNNSHSTSVISSQTKPLLDVIKQHLANSNQALQVLSELSTAIQNTNSATAQRFILEKIDELVAARVLHTSSDLRDAEAQAESIVSAVATLLDDTQEAWEAGWCQPENWSDYVE